MARLLAGILPYLGWGLLILIALRALRARLTRLPLAVRRRRSERVITLDDFEPTEAQRDQIRRAVADMERQRTLLGHDALGREVRAEAGRLFGIVHGGELVMFYQWRGSPSEDRQPGRAARKAFWTRFPEAVDDDGWPVKPEKVFEVNPGLYGPPTREYVPAFDPDHMHPALRREVLN